jgi:hypothetical protein
MKPAHLATIGLALGLPLAAQDANFGIGISFAIPTGAYRSADYPAYGAVPEPTHESYDNTVGVQFTISFPVRQSLAIRFDAYGHSTTGEDTTPGYASYNLEHDLLCLGGEAQWFPFRGDAFLHRGTYLLGGASLDLERFSSSYGNPYWTGYTLYKTRLGGLAGIGYSFRPIGRWRTTAELAFHKTLTGYNSSSQAPAQSPATPAADFIRATYGVIF